MRGESDKGPDAGQLSQDPEVSKIAALLSGARKIYSSVDEFEQWVNSVEQEPARNARICATQMYIVYHEEQDPVSSRFYRIVGRLSPEMHAYIGPILTFMALAAASGVVGNLTYDALKALVLPFLRAKEKTTFEERLTFEEYETVRKEIHMEDASSEPSTTEIVEKEVGLKYRLIFERKTKE
ncbi:MAG TPA: hypothetical protein VK608_04435 [Edaphobacter sp.]|nr:hypothetical protein [Edaphobacter sp.]